MNIVLFDSIFPIGHKSLNNRIVDLIPPGHRIIVLDCDDYYIRRSDIVYKTIHVVRSRGGVFLNQCIQTLNLLKGFVSVFLMKKDVLIFLTFDITTFVLCTFLFPFTKKIIFHHNNTDQLTRKSKKFFFSIYKNRVYHFVFAHFIKKYLVDDLNVKENRLFVFPHPLKSNNDILYLVENADTIFIGLGISNDDNLIKAVIEYENETHLLRDNLVKLILRSNSDISSTNEIIVIKGFLSDEKYNEYFVRASGVVLLYPLSYRYRYSGMILDALQFKKVVFGINIPIVSEFSASYPNSVYTFSTICDLFKLLLSKKRVPNTEYNSFLKEHSDLNVVQALKNVIENQNQI